MCTTCGCGSDQVSIAAPESGRHAHIDAGHHAHEHTRDREADTRLVQIEQHLLGKNNRYAAANRELFEERGVFSVNLMSSPGSGKTTLLVKTVTALKCRLPIAVIEGDQQTSHDAELIRSAGVPGIQINTGKGCHLDAQMIGHALEHLPVHDDGLLFIENVGNLVCPAAFDLGETRKVVIISVTEGENKPVKYPDMFVAADLMLINKVDLIPYLEFDIDRCIDYARRVNPRIDVMEISATSGAGFDDWCEWLLTGHGAAIRGKIRGHGKDDAPV